MKDQPDTAPDPAATALPPISPLRAAIEAILLVVDSPVSAARLANALGEEPDLVARELRGIDKEYRTRGNGFCLRESEEGWRLYTRPENHREVEAFLLDGSQSTLSRAALETLAIIAYRQPVTRSQIAAIRGVNVDGVVRTLTLRGLIKETEQQGESGAHLYETTSLFTETMGIQSLDDLPNLAPLLPDIDHIDEQF